MSAKNTSTAKVKKIVKIVPSKSFIEKNAMLLIGVFIIIGLFLRIYRLGFMSLWVDEYMHAMAAVKGNFSHGENNGVLLTWINTSLGFVIGTSEFALRLPVAIIGSFLIYFVYVLGKSVFNIKVGLMSALFAVFSIYLIFWSRVDRPYGIVPAFYTWLLVCFWMMLESNSTKSDFLSKIGINKKYLFIGLLALLLSMLSQLICFLFIFSAGFYGTFVTIDNWIKKKTKIKSIDAYNILFYLNILILFLMFTPIGLKISRPILELFLPKAIAQFILPDINNILSVLKSDNWDKCYNTYSGVLSNDFKSLEYLGWSGIVFALIKNRKQGYFLISAFVIPYLLLSFIFTSTSHAKYLIQIYPIFLVSAAYAIYFIAFEILAKIDKKAFSTSNKSYVLVCNVVFILMLTGMTHKDELKTILNSTEHGKLVNSNLAEVSFVNWKQPCEFLNANKKKDDVVLATVQVAPRYYLGLDSVAWFRQMKLNPKWNMNSTTEEKYIQMGSDGKKVSASSYEDLLRTYNENPRGWLLADYYLDNALTDPRCKQFVEENFVFHFTASDDGGVKVFSWDKSKPKQYQSSFVIEMGKNENQMGSMPLNFTIGQPLTQAKVKLVLLTQGIDSNNEAFIIINDKQVAIRPNGNSANIAPNVMEVPSNYFVQGNNNVQFAYNGEEGNGDVIKGCVIYNMMVQ